MTEELRNIPVQARSNARLQQLLSAAEEAYTDPEIGRDRITTNDVARIAKASIGTVYRYFPDRVAVLDAIRPHRDKDAKVVAAIKRVLVQKAWDDEKKLERINLLVNPEA